MSIRITVEQGDVTKVPSDLLLMKHAESFYGADEVVALRLVQRGICKEADISPADEDCVLVDSNQAVASKQVLFLGTVGLGEFRYNQMRQFARRAIETIARRQLHVRTLTTTIHGPGYGLDIEEALQAMIFGFQQGLAAGDSTPLEQIVCVERNPRRFEMLSAALHGMELVSPAKTAPAAVVPAAVVPAAAALEKLARASQKKCVFVAMPFLEEFEDVYQFGIYSAVRASGYVCEKVDESVFAGNIVDRITSGIQNAEFVIADVTLEKPNVYLEIGFAWGLQRPVILVAREGQRLHFDLSHHKCIFYKTIGKLAEELERTIRKLSREDIPVED